MDRQVKFRGKRIDNGEWVYGGVVVNGKYNQSFIVTIETIGYMNFTEVDPSTVGQFTGLKDRNGKEIYFKDIVKDPSGNYFVVEWYEQEMRIVLKRQDVLYGFNVPLYEVVGNVFENPELL